VAVAILAVSGGAVAMAVGSTPAPRPSVAQAILRGGPYDGMVVEIAPGQSEIHPTQLVAFGSAGALPKAAYTFTGRTDRRHRAIFEQREG
jgi:hypothetical protein